MLNLQKPESFQGLPVVSFEDVEQKLPPIEYDMFIAVGYHDLNNIT